MMKLGHWTSSLDFFDEIIAKTERILQFENPFSIFNVEALCCNGVSSIYYFYSDRPGSLLFSLNPTFLLFLGKQFSNYNPPNIHDSSPVSCKTIMSPTSVIVYML
uniref:Uncharacterized protein n=1 Tax=Cacopsylla melanoneura TaxID=428564 RepID=A0A8D9FD99_9HEMI